MVGPNVKPIYRKELELPQFELLTPILLQAKGGKPYVNFGIGLWFLHYDILLLVRR
jgi:hypothetical protein